MNQLTPRTEKAIAIALQQHRGNHRKINGLPEVTHPFKVYRIAKLYTANEDILIATLLHDVPDDTGGYGLPEIRRDFGENVATIVADLICSQYNMASLSSNWRERKETMLQRLNSFTPAQAFIYTCDKIHDMESLIKDCRKHGDSVWDKFNAPPDQKRWYYTEVVPILRVRCPESALLNRLEKAWQELSPLIPRSFMTRCST